MLVVFFILFLLASFSRIINKSICPDCIPFDSCAGKHCDAAASTQLPDAEEAAHEVTF